MMNVYFVCFVYFVFGSSSSSTANLSHQKTDALLLHTTATKIIYGNVEFLL